MILIMMTHRRRFTVDVFNEDVIFDGGNTIRMFSTVYVSPVSAPLCISQSFE